MFSIIIPSFNNFQYLKLCVNSIKKNSKFDHQIILHINEGSDGSLDYVKENNIEHTYSKKNIGLCSAANLAAKKAITDYIIYSHDDMYFCPEWDEILFNEINKTKTNFFIFSIFYPFFFPWPIHQLVYLNILHFELAYCQSLLFYSHKLNL